MVSAADVPSIGAEEIRSRLVHVGRDVGAAVHAAVEAFLSRDADAAFRIALGDRAINRELRALETTVERWLRAEGGPAATFAIAASRSCVALERIGDYAASIARSAVRSRGAVPPVLVAEYRRLERSSSEILFAALDALAGMDAELARRTKLKAKRSERDYPALIDELLRTAAECDAGDAFALGMVLHRLQRVSDQAKNLCEETLFQTTGARKAPKQYRVLFLDRDSALYAPLLASIAEREFPRVSFGFGAPAPAHKTDPMLFTLGQQHGLDLGYLLPQRVDLVRSTLEGYHVIAELGPGVDLPLGEVPYSSVLVRWTAEVGGRDPEADTQALLDCLRQIMATLLGDDKASEP